MGAHDDTPVTKMETSVLSQSAFRKLGIETIGQLCATSSYEFMEAAYACAADDQRVAPALSEVSQILADLGLALKRDALDPLPTEVAKDGPAAPSSAAAPSSSESAASSARRPTRPRTPSRWTHKPEAPRAPT
jgi:hypothetical protein